MDLLPLVPALWVLALPGGATPTPLAHTYSIVARDPATGEMGVAVQSHYFSVGPIVPWAESGVGAGATQSLVLVDYGPKGLDLMRQGLTAQKAGGDIRGKQSAAILIVRGQSSGKPWADRVLDLRVEDSVEPLKELRRLVRLRRAYTLEDDGDNFIAAKKPDQALKAYEEASKLAPDVVELQFWAAVSMYTNGREADALKLFREVFSRERQWEDLAPRLAQVGVFPNDPRK